MCTAIARAEARFTSVDVSADSLAEAGRRAERAGLTNVEFRQGDIFDLPFDAGPSTMSRPGAHSHAARAAIQCQVRLQEEAGGNAMIGRRLHPLMVEAGLGAVRVSPRMVYVDSSRPDLVDGFTRRTFTAMIEGVQEPANEAGLTDPASFEAGVRDLHRTTEADGVFCYTFFKGVGTRDAHTPRRAWPALRPRARPGGSGDPGRGGP